MATRIEDEDGDQGNGFDLNVPQSANRSEVSEFEDALGGSGKKEGGSVESDEDRLEQEEEAALIAAAGGDEDSSRAKRSEDEQDAGSEQDRQAVREHKRQSRMNQQQRAREKISSLERQLAQFIARDQEMSRRIGSLETNNLGSQAQQLDQAALEADNAEAHYMSVISDGTVKGDGQRVAEATNALMEIKRQKELIANAKQNLQQAQQAQQRPQQRPADPAVAAHVNRFMSENRWYTPRNPDADSAALTAIDAQLSREGWNPSTPEYWDELKTRASAYSTTLATKLGGKKSIDNERPIGNGYNAATPRPQRSPVAGSGSNNPSGGSDRNRYTLSPQRVQAMKEAGMWDDMKVREKVVAEYRKLDAQMASDRRN